MAGGIYALSDIFREIDNCVTAPEGFRAGVTASGIKSDSRIPDLAILASDVPCVAAGTFTTSSTRAAPVLVCQERLKSGKAQAVVVNSGNANCATGDLGLMNAYRMTELAAQKLKLENDVVLCSSTGIIGRQLPMEKVTAGVAAIKLSRDQGNAATMLCYLTTDAAIEYEWMRAEVKAAVDDSFNMMAMDGDMSTNDTCILFANGLAGNTPINAQHPEANTFREALRRVTTYLAREMARDGEGATKLMTVHVRGAQHKADAVRAARSITLSPLWQCALAGGDPNWGRIVAALGASGCELNQATYDISIGDVQVMKHGMAAQYDQEAARQVMAQAEVTITIDLHIGEGRATAWGCDLTHGYIDENTLYTR